MNDEATEEKLAEGAKGQRQPETKAAAFDRRTNKALRHLGEANLEFAVAILERRRRGIKGQRCRASSNYGFTYTMVHLDAFLKGKPFREATPDELRDYLAPYVARETGRTQSIRLGLIMREALGLDEVKELPKEIRRSIYVAKKKTTPRGQVIPEPAFLAALEAVPRLTYTAPHAAALIRAVLWTLWDAGFRIGELLSLRINDCTFDDATRTAKLSLREELTETHGLKTGARYVIIRDAVPALKEWLQAHPWIHNGEAPLFTALGYFRHARTLNDDVVNDVIREAFALVGAKPVGKRPHFSAHDFRHTSATHYAENGATDSDLRFKYGWSGTSPMPAWYVHQSERKSRERAMAAPATGRMVGREANVGTHSARARSHGVSA
ncbi:MAG: site-specific integrase [Halobacteriales archaeon]|nr:site-specific integrase [Halobacteriales archaeon]